MTSVKPVAMLLGGIAMLAQIVLLRAFMAIFWGNELLVGLILAVWMATSGLGSWLGNRGVSSRPGPLLPLTLLLQAAALTAAIAALLLLPGARTILHVPAAGYLTTNHLFLLSLLTIVPVAFPLGCSFTLLARAAAPASANPAALVYVWDAAGCVAGSLLFTFILVRWTSPVQALLAAALLLLLMAGWRLGWRGWHPPAGLLLVMLFLHAPGIEQNRAAAYWRSFAPGMDLRTRATSRHGELAVVDWHGATSLFSNGALQATLPNPVDSQADAALLMNQSLPSPGEILLIGDGLGGLAPELARYPEASVTCIELDEEAGRLALNALPDSLAAAWRNPRLTLRFTDGRHFLQRSDRRYALIIVDAGRPSGALANRYYTEEFFALAKSRLLPGGVLALLNVPSGENYLGPELLRLNSSIYSGLRRFFTEIIVIPGGEALFLAGVHSRITADPDELARRLEEKKLALNYFYPSMFAFMLPAERISELENRLASAPPRRNLDFQPVVYFIDLLLWQKMIQGGGTLLLAIERLGYTRLLLIWVTILTLLLLPALQRKAAPHGRSHEAAVRRALLFAAFSVGMAATAFDVLFIMAMQNIFGNLYAAIGLALAAFMAGMAGGGWLALRSERRGFLLPLLLLLLIALSALVLTPFFGLLSARPWPPLFYAALLAVSGLAGALFPLLSGLHARCGGSGRWGSVNGAELAGGAAGALLIGGLWVPLFGFARTLGLVAAANLAGVLAIALCARPHDKENRCE